MHWIVRHWSAFSRSGTVLGFESSIRMDLTGLMPACVKAFIVSLVLTRFMQEMLFGVGRFDPATFVGVSAVLLLVSAIASSVPAYRAARLDPMQTLREQ